jgi:hypothetical protein
VKDEYDCKVDSCSAKYELGQQRSKARTEKGERTGVGLLETIQVQFLNVGNKHSPKDAAGESRFSRREIAKTSLYPPPLPVSPAPSRAVGATRCHSGPCGQLNALDEITTHTPLANDKFLLQQHPQQLHASIPSRMFRPSLDSHVCTRGSRNTRGRV